LFGNFLGVIHEEDHVIIKKIRRLHRSGILGLAIKGEIGNLVAKIGESIGSQRLIYNLWTYQGFHRLAIETAPAMVGGICQNFPNVHSVVDLGCGTGVYVSEFRKHGIQSEGYEYSDIARSIARDALHLEIKPFDLMVLDKVDGDFDLCTCFEVAEHLTPQMGERLIEICTMTAPRVIFSAASTGQGGQGHINEQPKDYWIERFGRKGFNINLEATTRLEQHLRKNLFRGFWLADNVSVFERRP